MTITEYFQNNQWYIEFKDRFNIKRTFDSEEFPFTGKEITGRPPDREEEHDANCMPTVEIWEIP